MIQSQFRLSILVTLSCILILGLAGCAPAAQEPGGSSPAESVDPPPTSTMEVATAEPVEEANAEPAEEATPLPEEEATAEPVEEATAEPAQEATSEPVEEAAPSGSSGGVFAIVPEESEARFRIDEVLFGADKEVVGRTNGVNGEIQLDPDDPASTQIGTIQIDARSLETDDSFRNRALRQSILDSRQDEFQYIIFTPTELRGLPESVSVGDEFTFEVVGDLKIRDVVQPVTFDMTVTATSMGRIDGSGSTVVVRPDFDLRIPRVPGVANVSEEVTLEIDFMAVRTE